MAAVHLRGEPRTRRGAREWRAALRAAVLAALIGSGGCRAFEPSHVFGFSHSDHWWHTIPAVVVAGVAMIPTTIAALPIMFVEECVGVNSVFSMAREDSDPTPSSAYAVFVPAFAVGYVTALPFVLLGLPFEELDAHEAPVPPPRSANAPATEPPPEARRDAAHADARSGRRQ